MAADSRVEMRQVRNYLRDQMRLIKNDPFLADIADRVSARIVKWNKKQHAVLVCIRDLSAPETTWNSKSCRWLWVHTWRGESSYPWLWKVWGELNDVINNMRLSNKQPQ